MFRWQGPVIPDCTIPSGACKPNFKVARSLKKTQMSKSLWKIPKNNIISKLATLKLLEPVKN